MYICKSVNCTIIYIYIYIHTHTHIYIYRVYIYIYIYIYIYVTRAHIKVKLATLVEGDPKAPFSIATQSRCRKGRYSIPWIAPLYLYQEMLCVKQGGIKYQFLTFGMTRSRIEPQSPGPLANTLLIRPIACYVYAMGISPFYYLLLSTIKKEKKNRVFTQNIYTINIISI